MPSRSGGKVPVPIAALLAAAIAVAVGCESGYESADSDGELPDIELQQSERPADDEDADVAAVEEEPAEDPVTAPPEVGPGPAMAPAAPGRSLMTAWATLLQGADEPDDFGLYSYLVFAGPPTEATRPRYLAALQAILDYDPVDDALVYADRGSINLTFIPVRGAVIHQPESLLEEYDYARARAILRQVDVPADRGPYLLSSTAPLDPRDPAASDASVLWQDLAAVPPELARLWVREYMSQAVSDDGFDGQAGARWVVRLRTGIEQVATAWPVVSDSLDSLVRWVGRIRGDGA